MDSLFVYYLQLLFSLLNNPLFAPPHYSGTQEPSCQPIDALPPQLLQEPRQPIDNLPQLLLHFFVKVSQGRACNDYNLNFFC
jgi:hypothetical protein